VEHPTQDPAEDPLGIEVTRERLRDVEPRKEKGETNETTHHTFIGQNRIGSSYASTTTAGSWWWLSSLTTNRKQGK
jgi:hypothetical protein